ncbi:MAG: putative zinc ribbon domain protein [Verrucomicrobiales bacterium]|nr:putative zinc ribbon domain protein [Verrucomicrobiales bacterium]
MHVDLLWQAEINYEHNPNFPMLDAIEKLLILQDRDRKIMRLRSEIAHSSPEQASLKGKASSSQANLDASKQKVMHLESERKRLELEVVTLKEKIAKYSTQQFQTKKNEEFKALGHEMDNAKEAIVKLEDQQIELMEKIESAQKEVAVANSHAGEMKKNIDQQLASISGREVNQRKELAELESTRNELSVGVPEPLLNKYDRLLKSKGDNPIVGIHHCVCGGCHMKLPPQAVLSCKAEQEPVSCPNCGRLLFYTRDMDLALVD